MNIFHSLSQERETIYTSKEQIVSKQLVSKGLCIKTTGSHRGTLTQGCSYGKDKQAFLVVKLTFLLNCISGTQQRFPPKRTENTF